MKTASDYACEIQRMLTAAGYPVPPSVRIANILPRTLAAQQEAFKAGFEAAREKAAEADPTPYYRQDTADGYGDGMAMEAEAKLKAIRAIPTPEMPTEGEQGNG